MAVMAEARRWMDRIALCCLPPEADGDERDEDMNVNMDHDDKDDDDDDDDDSSLSFIMVIVVVSMFLAFPQRCFDAARREVDTVRSPAKLVAGRESAVTSKELDLSAFDAYPTLVKYA